MPVREELCPDLRSGKFAYTRTRDLLSLNATILLVGLGCLLNCRRLAAEELAPSPNTADSVSPEFNPNAIPTVEWLSDIAPISNGSADATEQMQPYTEAIRGTDVSFEMLPIPGGSFLMGSPDDETRRKPDEGPVHRVQLDPFWMGKFEVTWDEFELWANSMEQRQRERSDSPSTRSDELADAITRPTKPFADLSFAMGKKGHPAICMTQLAAKCYCKWLSAKTGRYYRLPTEAEWEYACRAGTTTAYSYGDDPNSLDEYGWFFDNGEDRYHAVGSKKPNPWGLYDMHGNVSEWVLDGYETSYAAFEGKTTVNPIVAPTAVFSRVARGGCWDDDPEGLRSAARKASDPKWNRDDPRQPQSIWYHTDSTCPGFRVVRPLHVPSVEESAAYEPNWKAIEAYSHRQTNVE